MKRILLLISVVASAFGLSGCHMPGSYVAPPPVATGTPGTAGGQVSLPAGSDKKTTAPMSTAPGMALPTPGK